MMKFTSEGQKKDNLVYISGVFKSLLSKKRIEWIAMERTKSYYSLVSEKFKQHIEESKIFILFDSGDSIYFPIYYHEIQSV